MHPILQPRIDIDSTDPPLVAYCADFDGGQWRLTELVRDVFDRHLTSFALSLTKYSSIDGDSAAASLRRAAKAVYNTDKYKSRGEFGELFLHAILRDYYNAHPAVSKIFFKDSDNDTVKGFDAVHLVEHDGRIELWLGEVKFYADLDDAIRSVCAELKIHTQTDYLRREFVAITSKLDPAWEFSASVEAMLDENQTLDAIVDALVVPVLLTYESQAVKAATVVSDAYIEQLQKECEDAWERFSQGAKHERKIRIILMLLPISDKRQLLDQMHSQLKIWQQI